MAKFFTGEEVARLLERQRPDILAALDEAEPRHELVKAVIAERLRRGWSQEHLAKEAGLTQTQVSRLERGQIGNFKTLERALNALGLKLVPVPLEQAASVSST